MLQSGRRQGLGDTLAPVRPVHDDIFYESPHAGRYAEGNQGEHAHEVARRVSRHQEAACGAGDDRGEVGGRQGLGRGGELSDEVDGFGLDSYDFEGSFL